MHWTLPLITSLVGLLYVAAFIQWRMVGNVRVISLLIASAWVVQQSYFWATGDRFPAGLFLVCDAFICAFLWKARFHWTDTSILLIYPCLWEAYLTLEPKLLWWVLYWGTFSQMVLALPWPSLVGLRDKELFHGGR